MKKSFYILSTAILLVFSVGYTTTGNSAASISKIYLTGNTLIKSDPLTSISFYNVSNPSAVTLLSSLPLIGNHDVAVRNNTMYADRYSDLYIYNISDASNPILIDSIRNVFDHYDFFGMPMMNDMIDHNTGFWGCNSCGQDNFLQPASSGGTGRGGSLARFFIKDDYLFCIDNLNLVIFSITQPSAPQFRNRISIDWSIETIFGYKNYLFIGGALGMYIYDISNPEQPVAKGQFLHARACDPVVVEDDIAYVTLRSGSSCGPAEDELHILDVKNVNAPQLLKSYGLYNPYGLSVRNKIVFVCDEQAGLKVIDTNDLNQVKIISEVKDLVPSDNILDGDLLFIAGRNWVYIYNVSDIHKPVLIARF